MPSDVGGVAVLTGDALQGGTKRRSGADLAEALEGWGSGLRVSTGWDSTTVSLTCVAERVGDVLALLSEVVRTPSFPVEEVERVRIQRLASIQQRRMNPGSLADDELDRRIFASGHPYHRPLAGDERSVTVLGREDLASFASMRYTPARAGLVLVGDLSPSQAEDLTLQHFDDWGPGEGQSAAAAAPGQPTRRSIVVIDRPSAVQSELRIGQSAPPRGNTDEFSLRVANTVLGGAFTSRLNLSLREKHGFTYGARSSFAFRRDGGAFTISTAVLTEVTAPALKEAMAVFELFAESGPSPEELARARDFIAGVFPLRMETTSQLAARLAELLIFDLPDDYHHTYRDRIRAVDLESARVAVRANLDPDRSAVVVVGDAERIGAEVEALELGPVEVVDP